jgi:tetratricopeptide (TPR) repeat protein
MKEHYISITQDGIARISFSESPKNIKGVYTSGLGTAIFLVLMGSKGMSVMHYMGRIAKETLQAEMAWVGELRFWDVGFNPKCHTLFDEKIRNILSAGLKRNHYKHSNLKQYQEIVHGGASVDRQGNIDNQVIHLNELLEPYQMEKRYCINVLNHFCQQQGKSVPGDLQFNGTEFTECPELLRPLEEMHPYTPEQYASAHYQKKLFYVTLLQRLNQLKNIIIQESTISAHSPFTFFRDASITASEWLAVQQLVNEDPEKTTPSNLHKNAVNLYKNKKYPEAAKFATQAAKLFIEKAAKLNAATSYSVAASCYRELNEWAKAKEAAKTAYELRKEVLGDSHEDTLKARNKLDGICTLAGEGANISRMRNL